MCRINFHPWQPVCPLIHRLDLADSCRSPHWKRRGAAHSIRPVSQLRTAFPCCKQERSPIAGFSACGGTLLRHNSLPPHGDPRKAFLCHGTYFPMTEKKPLTCKGFSGDGGIRTHVPGISRQTHFECAALRPLRYVSVYLWDRRPGVSRPLFPIIHDISSFV